MLHGITIKPVAPEFEEIKEEIEIDPLETVSGNDQQSLANLSK